MRQETGLDSLPRVGNLNCHLAFFPTEYDLHLSSVRRELDGVGQQV